jgi:exodeoxyribonuclease-5
MTITLTDLQAAALRRAKAWFETGTAAQQVFSIAGYAGTGKSTIVRFLVEDLGLADDEVLYGTFTGKAAHVLRKKGTPCQTIHSLIYRVHEASEEEIAAARKRLEKAEADARDLAGIERVVADAKIQALKTEITDLRRPRFGLNPESAVRDCKLLVLDEVSMVGPEMEADIISFGKPVLILGDPGQLPPIKGAGAFTRREPDVMLTEIHRQAAESAVIRLATMARTGEFIPYGQHDDYVWKMSGRDVGPAQLLNGGQVICGLNASRIGLNNAMRRAAGFEGALPTGRGEKIICLKNDHALGLLNGMFLELGAIEAVDDERFRATITSDEGGLVGGRNLRGKPNRLSLYAGHFLDHQTLDPQRDERDWKIKRRLIEATFGWAITCHKAQGSQWENVIVIDDHWAKPGSIAPDGSIPRSRGRKAGWLSSIRKARAQCRMCAGGTLKKPSAAAKPKSSTSSALRGGRPMTAATYTARFPTILTITLVGAGTRPAHAHTAAAPPRRRSSTS